MYVPLLSNRMSESVKYACFLAFKIQCGAASGKHYAQASKARRFGSYFAAFATLVETSYFIVGCTAMCSCASRPAKEPKNRSATGIKSH